SNVESAINQVFHGSGGPFHEKLAVAKNKQVVMLAVPQQYKHNLPHYLRVVRLVPIPDGSESQQSDSIAHRRPPTDGLLDPSRTVVAALRLEAVGQDSVPTLKLGLTSKHPLVRFTSAEALAYLGDPGCGEELAKAAEEQPALRAYALTAMASLDEGI